MTPAAFAFTEEGDLAKVFFTGLRFDLLVLGFFLIPVVLIGTGVALAGRGFERMTSLSLRYLVGAWTMTCVLAAVDLLFFAVTDRRLTLVDWRANSEFFGQAWRVQGPGTALLVIAIVICTWVIGGREILSAGDRRGVPSKTRRGPAWRMLQILGPLVLVALMARGTVTAHHLERQHSQISNHQVVNELALNAVWCFDKEPQNR